MAEAKKKTKNKKGDGLLSKETVSGIKKLKVLFSKESPVKVNLSSMSSVELRRGARGAVEVTVKSYDHDVEKAGKQSEKVFKRLASEFKQD